MLLKALLGKGWRRVSVHVELGINVHVPIERTLDIAVRPIVGQLDRVRLIVLAVREVRYDATISHLGTDHRQGIDMVVKGGQAGCVCLSVCTDMYLQQ